MIRKNQDNQPEDLLHLDLVDAYALLFDDFPECEAALEILARIISDDTDNALAYSHYLGAIYAAIELGDIAKATTLFDRLPVNNYHLGHYIRDYRTIVHPAKEVRMKENVSHENVTTMWSVLCRLIGDLFS